MMETKKLSHGIPEYCLDSDGLLSWEEFYGSSNEGLVESILEMYDLLIGRSTEKVKEDLINSEKQIGFENCQTPLGEPTNAKEVNKEPTLDNKKSNPDNRCDIIEQNWNCRCVENSAIEPITRCAACDLKESKIRSTDIRESQISKNELVNTIDSNSQSEPSLSNPIHREKVSKCELITCPAGSSPPSTPAQQRFRRLILNQLPHSLKRSEIYFRWVARPSSVTSLTSFSSSSSGASSCLEPSSKPAHLASVETLETLEGDSDGEDQKDKSSRLSKETGGSEDSGVDSLCTSLPQNKSKYCDPHLTYMDKVVTEIIETEEVYVGDLRKIIEGYLMKWRSLNEFPLSDRLDVLFGNIEAVFNFNSLFLKELKECGLDPVKVARCFVRNNAGFSVYTEYCTNYPKTVSLLTELMRQEGIVRLFREQQAALQHTLPLGSYLLKPVQRILKYHLLLQNIVKQYSTGSEGHRDIEDALRTMTEIAQHINDMKRRHEHEVRVQEIQSLLLGWEGEDLTTYGELCAEGAFRIHGAKALRHVFLFDKMLLITKQKEGGILDYKTHINCSNLMLIESVPGEPLSFHVIPFDNPRSQYTLKCRNIDQKREWTWQVKRVILENYNAVIPTHARQLVMELGQSKSNDIQSNKILSKRHHTAPEYLEKRKHERGKPDSSFKSRIRTNKKFKSGNNSEDQFNNVTNTVLQAKFNGSHSLNDGPANETDHIQITDEKGKQTDNHEKSEIRTLEQIVTQILNQNKEFDKILKRHLTSKSCDFNRRGKKKKLANSTRNLKFLRIARQEAPETSKDSECHSYSERVSLLDECLHSEPDTGKRVQSSASFTQAESCEKITNSFESMTLDDIPTSPSVWLRQQVQHLPVAPKKAGSLPRSFQIASDASRSDSHFFKDFRVSLDRPFTIASDKVTSNMLFEGMERFYRGQFRRSDSNTTENGSLTDSLKTPGDSLDHINIHPDYKIYRSRLSANILKNVLSTVHNKLSHAKMDAKNVPEPEKKAFFREKKAGRLLCALAKHYQKTLRNKHKSKNLESDVESCNRLALPHALPVTALPVYKQGSEHLGARLANFTQSEFRFGQLRCSKKAAVLLGVCADSLDSVHSVLSLQSAPVSAPLADSSPIIKSHDKDIIFNKSVNSVECFYESRLEEMDKELSDLVQVQDQELCEEKNKENHLSDQTTLNKEFVINRMSGTA